MAEEFLLTTANNLEGYIVLKQCGVVFGETVFKNSAMDQLTAGISNMIDSIRFKATEMTGQVELIENARQFAYEKLINAAKRKGANAVIALESDNTIGDGGIMYISLYGTAVKVISLEEKEEYDRKEEERKLKEKEELQRVEEAKKAFRDKVASMGEGGVELPELTFLEDITNMSSMMDIWKKWKEYNLGNIHPEIHKYIENKKEIERLYGRHDVKPMIEEIKKMLFGE